MELMGILEPGDAPKELMWYAFVPGGTAPSPRVGQTCMYLPAYQEGGKGRIVIIGGADPGCCFSDAHIINLDTYEWDIPNWEGMLPRYEHASFISTGKPGSIWVFGGAEQAENQNNVQVLNPGSHSWKSPKVQGCIPSPRTFHTTSASIGDKLFVFGGGEKGAEPVADKNLYVFDAANLTWTLLDTSGAPPKPRHGHTMVAVGNKLFVHGGMAGRSFYRDLFCFDTDTMMWEEVQVKGDVPHPCAAHSALSWEKCIYIFGGMTETGAVSTMHRYDTGNHTWTQIRFDSPSPAARLDHSMCLLPWKIGMELSKPDSELDNVTEKRENDPCAPNTDNESEKFGQVTLCLIFGGMDTNGELYNDCSVIALTK
ncbi:PREDICTED: rab9 effector protein with kelch motifs [Nanorana parkeri]|uniref:rab9 effector protein with kelch motifs n=1 Tax=Nanorana parkeri TaxID=125878 RepID=UPI0008548020|nr:PREDICTED: rab9 effector protein with kelch motifs [Nanorana parkeri]